jgi:hypothetical protein
MGMRAGNALSEVMSQEIKTSHSEYLSDVESRSDGGIFSGEMMF